MKTKPKFDISLRLWGWLAGSSDYVEETCSITAVLVASRLYFIE